MNESLLTDVRKLLQQSLADTSLGSVLKEHKNLVGSGKMLRTRLGITLAEHSDCPDDVIVHSAAAIEMLHGASLLHDDVIDGAEMRRRAASFWVDRGTSGAILLGDLFLCLSIDIICKTANGSLTPLFIGKAKEMCDAESEQELLLRKAEPTWDICMSLARRKTGSLFSFMGLAAGWPDENQMKSFEEAAYRIGTAYQLADDLLDTCGDEDISGKTAGTDSLRGKITAASKFHGVDSDPLEVIWQQCDFALSALTPYPKARESLADFIEGEFRPVIKSFTSTASA